MGEAYLSASEEGQPAGGESTRSVRGRINDACLERLVADSLLDPERRTKLRSLLAADKPAKAESFVTLFEERPNEDVK